MKLRRPKLRHLIAAVIVLIGIAVVGAASAPLWQKRWVEAPAQSVRFEPSSKVVDAADLGPESAYAWLLRAVKSAAPELRARSTKDSGWKDAIMPLETEIWSEEKFPQTARRLEANAAALDNIRKALAAPDPALPTPLSITSSSQQSFLSPGLSLAQLLSASASRSASRGDFDAMADDLENTVRLGRLLSTGGSMINSLMGVATMHLAANRTMLLARHYAFPDQITTRLTRLFEEAELALPDPVEVSRNEARMLLNEVDVLFGRRKPDSPDQKVIRWGGISPASISGSGPEPTRQNVKWFLEHLILLAEQGDDGTRAEQLYGELISKVHGIFGAAVIRDPIGALYASLSTPVHSLKRKKDNAKAGFRAATIALALERFQREKGRLPSDLTELVPVFLPSVPLDPYAEDAPLKMIPQPNSPFSYTLYSVGGNKQDDGGKRPDSMGRHAWKEADCVLFPPKQADK